MPVQVDKFRVSSNNGCLLWHFHVIQPASSLPEHHQTQQKSLVSLSEAICNDLKQDHSKNLSNNTRNIRKCCEAMLKSLKISLKTFSAIIDEDMQIVEGYFHKKISEVDSQRLTRKTRQWIFKTWLCQSPQKLEMCTRKFLESVERDNKTKVAETEQPVQLYVYQLKNTSNNCQETTVIPENTGQPLLLLEINLTVEDRYISQSLLWSPKNNSPQMIRNFSETYLLQLSNSYELNFESESFQESVEQLVIAIRTQIFYKTLLNKYAHLLLNFSALESDYREYLIPIQLQLCKGTTLIYEDAFEWDVLNELNNVEEFARTLITDNNLPANFLSQICYKIRAQIQTELGWKFEMMVRTFKEIHRDRQNPKLNTQTTAILKKNISCSMDVTIPALINHQNSATEPISKPYELQNSDLFSLIARNQDLLSKQVRDMLNNFESFDQFFTQNTQQQSHNQKNTDISSEPKCTTTPDSNFNQDEQESNLNLSSSKKPILKMSLNEANRILESRNRTTPCQNPYLSSIVANPASTYAIWANLTRQPLKNH